MELSDARRKEITEYWSKFIGTEIVEVLGENKSKFVGKKALSILVYHNSWIYGETNNVWYLVSSDDKPIGHYTSGGFSEEDGWLVVNPLPNVALNECAACLVEVSFASMSQASTKDDKWSVGPDGETQGYLDGHTGLSFL